MNKTKQKILEIAINPVTIKDIRKATGLNYPNLSKHIKELKKSGLLFAVAKEGKFIVIQTNKYSVIALLNKEIEQRKEIIKRLEEK